MKKKIVTSGVDSEYVLGGLCAYLRRRGWEVIELDFGAFREPAGQLLDDLAADRAIYMTSAHTNLTLRVAGSLGLALASLYPNYLAPLEIIPRLRPSLSVYIPHDLLSPFGDDNLNEYRFLDLFDCVLAPYEATSLEATLAPATRVYDAGWIKYAARREPGTDGDALRRRSSGIGDPKVVLFVSLVEQLKLAFGIPGIVDYLRPVFCKNVAVKLPAWKGLGTLEELLRATGLVEVIPAEANSIELIEQADVVVCNGVSSVHAEAALMGRPTICLLDDQGLTVSEQRQKLRRLPNIYFHDYRARTAIPCSLYEQLAGQSFARGAQTVRLRAGRAPAQRAL